MKKKIDRLIDSYTFSIEWSNEDKAHIAKCLEFPSVQAHGDNPEKALQAVKEALEASIEWMKENKEDIPEPIGLRNFKGNISLRVSSATHKQLAIFAAQQGVSLNQLITTLIEENLGSYRITNLFKELKSQIIQLQRQMENSIAISDFCALFLSNTQEIVSTSTVPSSYSAVFPAYQIDSNISSDSPQERDLITDELPKLMNPR